MVAGVWDARAVARGRARLRQERPPAGGARLRQRRRRARRVDRRVARRAAGRLRGDAAARRAVDRAPRSAHGLPRHAARRRARARRPVRARRRCARRSRRRRRALARDAASCSADALMHARREAARRRRCARACRRARRRHRQDQGRRVRRPLQRRHRSPTRSSPPPSASTSTAAPPRRATGGRLRLPPRQAQGGARAACEKAGTDALALGRDELAARAWAFVGYLEGSQQRHYDVAHQALDVSGAALQRIGNPPELDAFRLRKLASVLTNEGRHAEAIDAYQHALATQKRIPGTGTLHGGRAVDGHRAQLRRGQPPDRGARRHLARLHALHRALRPRLPDDRRGAAAGRLHPAQAQPRRRVGGGHAQGRRRARGHPRHRQPERRRGARLPRRHAGVARQAGRGRAGARARHRRSARRSRRPIPTCRWR